MKTQTSFFVLFLFVKFYSIAQSDTLNVYLSGIVSSKKEYQIEIQNKCQLIKTNHYLDTYIEFLINNNLKYLTVTIKKRNKITNNFKVIKKLDILFVVNRVLYIEKVTRRKFFPYWSIDTPKMITKVKAKECIDTR